MGAARRDGDFYALLGVERDATSAAIRWAYERELNRAHRAGAIKHAEELSKAYDTLSNLRRREVYDRHGLTPVRERSPGATPPPPPWRIAQQTGLTAQLPKSRRWRVPIASIFVLGITAGVVLTFLFHDGSQGLNAPVVSSVDSPQQVVCQPAAPSTAGYVYTTRRGERPSCANGAVPHVVGGTSSGPALEPIGGGRCLDTRDGRIVAC